MGFQFLKDPFHKNYMTVSFHVSTIYNGCLRLLETVYMQSTVMRDKGSFKGDHMKLSKDTWCIGEPSHFFWKFTKGQTVLRILYEGKIGLSVWANTAANMKPFDEHVKKTNM